MSSFLTYFTSGFGILILGSLLASFVSGQRIDAGGLGLIIFLLLAFLYALARKVTAKPVAVDAALEAKRLQDVYDHPKYADFLAEDPEREFIYKEELADKFAKWLERGR